MAKRTLPLFPLPLVLFPGTPLPLHIFEPRYREMLQHCLAGDREFGLIFRDPETPEREIPPGQVGCVAHIDSEQVLPDGRSNIVVSGIRRFALERFVDSDRSYHVGEVSEFEDLDEPGDLLAPLSERIRWLFGRVGRAARTLADDPDPLPTLPDDPAMLSFTIGSLVDIGPERRQQLLASRSPADRLRQLEGLLAPSVPKLERRAQVHLRAKSNGHGPQPTA